MSHVMCGHSEFHHCFRGKGSSNVWGEETWGKGHPWKYGPEMASIITEEVLPIIGQRFVVVKLGKYS